MNDPNLPAFICSVADLLPGDYRQAEYGKVTLLLDVAKTLVPWPTPTHDSLTLYPTI